MKNIALLVIALIILLVLLVVAGNKFAKKNTSSSTPAQSMTEGSTIKIGFLGPLSGDAAVYGEPYRNMTVMAVDQINANGGVNGKKIEVVYEDGKCNGKDATNAMQKLVNVEKVQVVIGGFCSSESLAAVAVAQKGKVALFSPGSSSPSLTGRSPYFFRNYPSDASQGKVLAEVAYKDKKWKKVAFIQEQLDYPLGIYKSFTQSFETMGGKVIKEEFVPQTSDFRSQLTKLQSQNPDAIFIDVQTPAAADRILKQLDELGWKPGIMISDIVAGDAKTLADNKTTLEGAYAAEFGTNPNNPKFKKMIADYTKKYKKAPEFQSYAQTEYDAVFMLKDALTMVGNNGQKIAAWSRTVKDWNGASGSITIEETGDRSSGHVAKIIKNGQTEPYTE